MADALPKTILLVDDAELNRYTTGRVLRQAGFDIAEAATGAEGLRLARDNPALILLDVQLPDISGFEVCRQLKDDPITAVIPVLHISASRGDSEAMVEGLEGGADGYLSAPVDPSVLVATVRALLRARQAEEQRRHLETQLLQSQKLESLGVLAGGVAHDFNNLLQVILGNMSLAQMKLPPDSPLRQILQNSEQAALKAAHLTKQMLAYSGRGRFVVQSLDLAALIRDTGQLLESVVSKKAELVYRLQPDLPPVYGDGDQLRQLVINLVANASDALEDRPGSITVATGVTAVPDADHTHNYMDEQAPPGWVFLEVVDTGVGMDEETQARVFEPFFTTKFTGRGLGLAAVLGIVRGHKGSITLHSRPGTGTRLRVLLPAVAAPLYAPPPPAAAEVPARETRTILVVDDEEGVRGVARMILEEFGYRVLTANDGQEGVDVFQQHADEIAVVLLDMTMPRMDGEEVFARIRQMRPDARVILSSGYDEEEATSHFAGKGLAGFLQKPYQPMALVNRLNQLLEVREP